MHLGIVITSNHPETVWNAFRLADFSLTKGDKTSVFLMANGVEADSLDSEKFDITNQMESFILNNGELYACGTCITYRSKNSSDCLLYTSPSPRDLDLSRMPSSA